MSILVSVVVTTYNSALYVLETLESIKAQTYKNIELIVSDDASADDTILIAREWLSENKQHFHRTDVITVPGNTGVSANCNRCIAAAQSDWIKFIAGDDILLPRCIENNMQFVSLHPEVKILFSYVKLYRNQFLEQNFIRVVPASFPMNIMNPVYTADYQFKLLLLSDRINFTPSYFFHRSAITSVGGYDEQNRFVEDYPMWLKLTRAGNKLFFMEKDTVAYRQHDKATNNKIESALVKPSMLKSYSFRREFVHPYLPWDLVASEKFTMNTAFLFEKLGWNRSTTFLKALFKMVTVYLNPFRYVIFLRKKLKGTNSAFYKN